ncbi:MAG: L-serine ammonia-lyase [Desulfobacteraceae bacterium]|nr:L-serine ammonia-lyase [Desulfobacteraceae bacterium]
MNSTFDIFKIGIGPSSSHTVGPMKAAHSFLTELKNIAKLASIARIQAQLYGSLSLTGKGHGTDKAIILGLTGELPETVDIDSIAPMIQAVRTSGKLHLLSEHWVAFDESKDIIFNDQSLPEHANGMRFLALDGSGNILSQKTFYSIGGGAIVSQSEYDCPYGVSNCIDLPFSFNSADELLHMGKESGLSIARIVMENEKKIAPENIVAQKLRHILEVMAMSIDNGCSKEGLLPGRLGIPRRARGLYRELTAHVKLNDPLIPMDWVSLWAIAACEENAAGGRIVTAPTNGAAGIIPAVIRFYKQFYNGKDEQGLFVFLLTAAAIGFLYQANASISGAEVGCQGEVGVACSMAAAGLTAALGGTNAQIENAAEIGMEHNLGLTCDPVAGLVQVPCIERNAMGAIKAINAARLALRGDGSHKVSLDKVIATMMQTGEDMKEKYKETSTGGLAVNVVEC